MKVTPLLLSAYFKEKCVTEACPFCEKTVWSLPSNGGPVENDNTDLEPWVFRHQLHNLDGGMVLKNIPTFIMICDTCGFIRQHTILPYQEWLIEREGNAN